MERWTPNSITHVLQRCWFPGELSPALCPNPFSTWKADKCVSGTSPLVFCLQADATYCSCCLTLQHAISQVRQIDNYTEVKSSAMTAVVYTSRNWPWELPCFVFSVDQSLKCKRKGPCFHCEWSKCLEPPQGPFPPRRMEKDVSWHH